TRAALESTNAQPEAVNEYLASVGTSPIDQPERLARLALRPEIDLENLLWHTGQYDELVTPAPGMESAARLVEIELKYAGYVERQAELVAKMEQLEEKPIPPGFDYHAVDNITMEAREKLSKIQPENLGQASRISGVSPADISMLMVLLKKG